jgi:hypothetical protein|nr:MAG: hypothetical protein [Lake Baikal virophage 10]
MSLASAINITPSVLGSGVPNSSVTTIILEQMELLDFATNPPLPTLPNPITNVSVQANVSGTPLSATTPLATLNEGYYLFSGIFNPFWFNASVYFNNGITNMEVQILDNNGTIYSRDLLNFSLADATTLVPNSFSRQITALVNITQPNTEIYYNIINLEFVSTTSASQSKAGISDEQTSGSFTFNYVKL